MNPLALIIAACAAASLVSLRPALADNLVVNGDFSNDADGWGTQLLKKPEGGMDKEADQGGRFRTHVADDGANGTKGCLKIDMEVSDDYSRHPSEVGIYANINTIPASEGSPAVAKVTLYAKSPDMIVPFLRVGRKGSGGGFKLLPLTSEWQKFEVVVGSPYSIGGILFSPSDQHGSTIVPGPVLLDEVTVQDVSDQPPPEKN